MTDLIDNPALFCLFHNDHRYETDKKEPCSHIFSAVVHAEKNGKLRMAGQDYDGTSRAIETDISDKQFNLATLVPIPSDNALVVEEMVSQINKLSARDAWPFYFSRDLSIRPERERSGIHAIVPEGHIDPPAHLQTVSEYKNRPENKLLARINCVRMSLLAAQIAGIHIERIGKINPASRTGEEVRDAIIDIYNRLLPHKANPGVVAIADSFSDKSKGNHKQSSEFIIANDGVCVVKSEGYLRAGKVLKSLERRVRGQSIFNWIAGADPSCQFIKNPMPIPHYLKSMLALD